MNLESLIVVSSPFRYNAPPSMFAMFFLKSESMILTFDALMFTAPPYCDAKLSSNVESSILMLNPSSFIAPPNGALFPLKTELVTFKSIKSR